MSSSVETSEGPYTRFPTSQKKDGRFIIPFPTWTQRGLPDLLKWQWSRELKVDLPKSSEELDKTLPILKPSREILDHPVETGIRACWIGHATVLVQMMGLNILTDPVFSERASPVQFMGPKRYRQTPLTVAELPKIDIVFLSHNHYDHLDLITIKQLFALQGDVPKYIVPLENGKYFRDLGITNVAEMDWWESMKFNTTPANHGTSTQVEVEVVCLPNQHWSRRGVSDTNQSLWGSFLIRPANAPSPSFWFAGDTGYCPVFKDIGERYGPIDFSAIPIGAYEPRWFMRPQHVNVDEAIQIHHDVGSKKSLGIHWGTFVLTDEFYLEPKQELERLSKEKGLGSDFIATKHGEVFTPM